MLLVNLSGGPGSGKSTTAAFIFAKLKMLGYNAELVGEEARELIYDGAIPMLENQVLILGQQWQRITRLQNHKADVAICDSPLSLSVLYSQNAKYHQELTQLVRKLESLIPNTFNIFVQRVKPYSTFGRTQKNVEEARALDLQARNLIAPIHLTVPGDEVGASFAAKTIGTLLKVERGDD